MTYTRTAIIVATVIGLAGCAAAVTKPTQSGFLSNYSDLEEVDKDHLAYDSGKLGNYSRFIIEPVAMLYKQPEGEDTFTDEQLEDLQEHVQAKISDAIGGDEGWEIVDEPGPGTATLRVGITEVNDTIGALNVFIYTKITGAGLGGASMESEFIDSQTGEQIAASVRWGSGSRVLRAGFTRTGDAKLLFNRWTRDFREAIDTAHGREP